MSCGHTPPKKQYNICTKEDIRKYKPSQNRHLQNLSEDARTRKNGYLSYYEVALVFDCNKGYIYSLYNKSLKKARDKGIEFSELQGKVVVQIEISSKGTVTNINVIESDIKNDDFVEKLTLALERVQFPEFDQDKFVITYPIVFIPPS